MKGLLENDNLEVKRRDYVANTMTRAESSRRKRNSGKESKWETPGQQATTSESNETQRRGRERRVNLEPGVKRRPRVRRWTWREPQRGNWKKR